MFTQVVSSILGRIYDISYPMFTQIVGSILGWIYHIPCSHRLWVRFLVGYIISHVHTDCGLNSWLDISYPMISHVHTSCGFNSWSDIVVFEVTVYYRSCDSLSLLNAMN